MLLDKEHLFSHPWQLEEEHCSKLKQLPNYRKRSKCKNLHSFPQNNASNSRCIQGKAQPPHSCLQIHLPFFHFSSCKERKGFLILFTFVSHFSIPITPVSFLSWKKSLVVQTTILCKQD